MHSDLIEDLILVLTTNKYQNVSSCTCIWSGKRGISASLDPRKNRPDPKYRFCVIKGLGLRAIIKGEDWNICFLREPALSCPGHSFLLGDSVWRCFLLPGGGLICGSLTGSCLSEGFTWGIDCQNRIVTEPGEKVFLPPPEISLLCCV